jgi:hypothetical protein
MIKLSLMISHMSIMIIGWNVGAVLFIAADALPTPWGTQMWVPN